MTKKKIVHGDDLLYRFFQTGLETRPELFAAVPQLLATTMGVWLPLDAYERWPVLLPWVVRDPQCRGNSGKGLPDEWSSPDARGYLRDDNSLIKGLPRALTISGPKGSHLHDARMGSEFVACHIWRIVDYKELASRHPLLNSFIPNLVWLPGQVAKLSDLQGGVIQQTLEAVSYALYRDAPVLRHLRPIVKEAWEMIPPPTVVLEEFTLDELNWFRTTPAFFRTRTARLGSVIQALDAVEQGLPLGERVVTRRYAAGLPLIANSERSALRAHLARFRDDVADP
jgi:hypothetical protein